MAWFSLEAEYENGYRFLFFFNSIAFLYLGKYVCSQCRDKKKNWTRCISETIWMPTEM